MSKPNKSDFDQAKMDELLIRGKVVHHVKAESAYAFTCKCNVKQLIPVRLLNRPSICSNCGCLVHVHAPE